MFLNWPSCSGRTRTVGRLVVSELPLPLGHRARLLFVLFIQGLESSAEGEGVEPSRVIILLTAFKTAATAGWLVLPGRLLNMINSQEY